MRNLDYILTSHMRLIVAINSIRKIIAIIVVTASIYRIRYLCSVMLMFCDNLNMLMMMMMGMPLGMCTHVMRKCIMFISAPLVVVGVISTPLVVEPTIASFIKISSIIWIGWLILVVTCVVMAPVPLEPIVV